MEEPNDDSPIEIVGDAKGSTYFDQVIGHIEDIVLSEEFEVRFKIVCQTFLKILQFMF